MITVGAHELTDIEAETLLAIYEFIHKQEDVTPTPLPPSLRDLTPMLGVKSTATANHRVWKLARKGLVVHDIEWDGISRASTRLTHAGLHVAWHLFREQESYEDIIPF